MLPSFLGIGAPRCGTTWIHRQLRDHPEAFVPREKEIHFFDKHYGRGLDWYASLFDPARGKNAVGEITPSYLYVEGGPRLIRECLGNVRLMVILRSPVERAYSHYWNILVQHREKGVSPGASFRSVAEQDPRIIQQGFYHDRLLQYLEVFAREDLLILLHDDLSRSPGEVWGTICGFLGIDPSRRSPWLAEQVNASGQKRVRSGLLRTVDRLLSQARLFGLARALNAANRQPIPAMDPEVRQELLEIYGEETTRLEALLGRRLDAWRV